MRNSKGPFCIMAFLPALLICSLFSSAYAVAIPQTTGQLVGNSSDVIRGKVVSTKSQWDDAHTVIFTTVAIEVSDIVFGSIEKGHTVSVYVPGGIVNDTGMNAEHAAVFEQGEDVVVFLTQLQGMYGVTSWEMGKFTVQNGNVQEKNRPVSEFIDEIKAIKK